MKTYNKTFKNSFHLLEVDIYTYINGDKVTIEQITDELRGYYSIKAIKNGDVILDFKSKTDAERYKVYNELIDEIEKVERVYLETKKVGSAPELLKKVQKGDYEVILAGCEWMLRHPYFVIIKHGDSYRTIKRTTRRRQALEIFNNLINQ